MIAILAAMAGLGIAFSAIRLLIRWAPSDIPRLSEAALDWNSFCFAAAVAALAAVVCSIIPGWSATRIQLESVLREGGVRSSMSRRGAGTQNLFILTQSALTVVLLAMAALLVLSYRSMMSADTGFANRDTLSMNLQLRGPGLFSGQYIDPQSRDAFYTRLLNRLREAPGVTSAAAVLLRPFEGNIGWDVPYEFEFQTGGGENRVLPKGNFEVVTPGYFQTVGTPLLEGRDFTDHDAGDGEPVAIISHTLAQRIRAAGHSPLGHRMRLGMASARWTKIIGISADARYRGITQSGADIFVPYLQASAPTNYLVICGTQPSQELAALVRRTLSEIDPTQAVAGVATIGELIDANTARHRFNMILLLWFGACAAILAATGIYSVIAESMAARQREIAIRAALGAQRTRLARDTISRTLGFVLIGELLGLLAVSSLGTLASDVLYRVSPRDPAVLCPVAALLFLVSLLAAFWPAWNASGATRGYRIG